MPGEWLPLLNVGGGEVVIQGTAIGAHASRTTTQSINGSTTTPVSFPTLIRDDASFWNSGADTKLTVAATQWHVHCCSILWASNATTSRITEPAVNQLNNLNQHRWRSTAGTPIPRQGGGVLYYATAADYFETRVWHDVTGGGALDVTSGEHAIATNPAWKGAFADRAAGTQSINNDTETLVTPDREVRDDEAYWDSGTATRMTVSADGWYIVHSNVAYVSNISGYRKLRLLVSGTTEYPLQQIGAQGSGGGAVSLGGSLVIYMTAGQYVEAWTKQTSGGALTLAQFYANLGIVRADGARGVDVQRTSAQTISLNTDTSISFQQENRDEIGFWHAGADTRITAPGNGWYLLTASVKWSNGTTTGDRRAFWRIDGTTQRYGNNFSAVNGDASTNVADALVYLTTGQYAELRVFTSGATMDVDAVRATCLLL